MKQVIIDINKCDDCPYLQMHVIDEMNVCACEKLGKVLFTQEDVVYNSDTQTVETPIDGVIHPECPLEDK